MIHLFVFYCTVLKICIPAKKSKDMEEEDFGIVLPDLPDGARRLLEEELACVVCRRFPRPTGRVHQCTNGHIICQEKRSPFHCTY